MPETISPDICVIGAGAGGPQVAVQAAGFGVGVVLVDPHAGPGGQTGDEAVRAGRLPLSALIAAARRAHVAAGSAGLGVLGKSVRIDFGRVRNHVQGVISARAPNLARERLAGLGVRVIEGAARFKNRSTLAVAGDIEIAARRFVIATGSSPALPPIAGLEAVPHLTTQTAFDLASCPEHLIVIGAGAIGLEFAQAFRRLGAQVTVLDAAEPLSQDDPECAAVVLRSARARRHPGAHRIVARVAEVEWSCKSCYRGGRQETIAGTHLLMRARAGQCGRARPRRRRHQI